MGRSKVVVLIRVRTRDGKHPFVHPVHTVNGRLKPLWGMVDGKAEHHPEGCYYLRYSEGGKRVLESVGTDSKTLSLAVMRRENLLQSRRLGLRFDEGSKPKRIEIDGAVQSFLATVQLSRSKKTFNEFNFMLPQFNRISGKRFLDEISREDFLIYISELRELNLSDRTIHNRVSRVVHFLKEFGFSSPLKPNDKPRFDQKAVEAYTVEEIRKLLAAGTPDDRALFIFFLGSGCREAEVANATYADLNISNKTFTVHSKVQCGRVFRPKDREERTVPLPDFLITTLAKRMAKKRADSPYIFPNTQGAPNGHFLRLLKRLAFEAGLNCGECVNRVGLSCEEHPVCSRWQLHKWRKSFATIHHESGVSARTLQAWLGHTSLETTLAYLKVADLRSARTREQVNQSFRFVAKRSKT